MPNILRVKCVILILNLQLYTVLIRMYSANR